jgi:hypothetical protein
MTTIIEELEWVAEMVFIVGAYLPLRVLYLIAGHGYVDIVALDRCDGAIG